MDPAGGHHPDPLVGSELEPSDEPPEARKNRVSRFNIQAEETFARLVVYAIRSSLHSSPDGNSLKFRSFRYQDSLAVLKPLCNRLSLL